MYVVQYALYYNIKIRNTMCIALSKSSKFDSVIKLILVIAHLSFNQFFVNEFEYYYVLCACALCATVCVHYVMCSIIMNAVAVIVSNSNDKFINS